MFSACMEWTGGLPWQPGRQARNQLMAGTQGCGSAEYAQYSSLNKTNQISMKRRQSMSEHVRARPGQHTHTPCPWRHTHSHCGQESHTERTMGGHMACQMYWPLQVGI